MIIENILGKQLSPVCTRFTKCSSSNHPFRYTYKAYIDRQPAAKKACFLLCCTTDCTGEG